MAKLLVQTSGVLNELATLAASAGAGSSGGIPHLDSTGRLSPTFNSTITCRVTADQAFSVTTLANATQLSLAVVSGTVYAFKFYVLFTTAAITTGIALALTGPSFTSLTYSIRIPISATTEMIANKQAYASSLIGTGVGAISTTYIAVLEGVIAPSASGSLIVQAGTEVAASAATIKIGSVGIIDPIP